jgi:hypothetical protein
MNMKKRWIKWRRARVIDAGVANGKRLRELEAARAGIDGSMWPDTARLIEIDIDRARKRQVKHIDYLKNTEAL